MLESKSETVLIEEPEQEVSNNTSKNAPAKSFVKTSNYPEGYDTLNGLLVKYPILNYCTKYEM